MSKSDIPGVIAPPPLIYLGFLFARAATPDAVELGLRTAWAALEVIVDPTNAAPDPVDAAPYPAAAS